jgi:hypothetical protein
MRQHRQVHGLAPERSDLDQLCIIDARFGRVQGDGGRI